MKDKINELRKEIIILKTYEIKPNYSYLANKYDLDSRTIKKYYEGYEGKPSHHNKKSKLDELHDIIQEKMTIPGTKISALYFYLKDKENYTGSYSSLTYYVRKHPEIKTSREKVNAHVRCETEPAEQMQFDWVEDISLTNKYG